MLSVGDADRSASEIALCESLIELLWKTADAGGTKQAKKPSPLSVFFHPETCLHNEGNWNNCLLGMAYVNLYKLTGNKVFIQVSSNTSADIIATGL